MDTHLQRPTDTLLFVETRQQIQSLYDAAYILSKGQYAQATKHLQDILITLPEKKYHAFQLEVKFNKILAEIYSTKQFPVNVERLINKCMGDFEDLLDEIDQQEDNYCQEEDEDQWSVAENLRIRIYTTIVQLSTKTDSIKLEDWLTKLIQKLRIYPKILPQIMGKLCGCKNLKQFCINFNSDQIIYDQSKNITKKAELLDLAASWLIIGGEYQKGKICKQLTVDLWRKANCLNESAKCQQQLKELKKNANSSYCILLKKIARITTKIYKQMDQIVNVKTKAQKDMSLIVRKVMGKKLQKIQDFNDELELMGDTSDKKKTSFWSSNKKSVSSNKKSFTQNNKLSEYIGKASQFYNSTYLKENNQEITSLLADSSKFIMDQKRIMSRTLVPMIQQFTIRQKYAFGILKNIYLVKCGLLNPKFLQSLEKGSSFKEKQQKTPKKQ